MPTPTEQAVPTLTHGGVRLRAAQPDDIAARQHCGYHAEFRRMVGADRQETATMTRAEAEAWYANRACQPYTWVIESTARAIGLTSLHQLDLVNRRARFSIGIFDSSCWGHGLGTAASGLVLGYAFTVLKLHRVDLRVLAYNTRAIRAYTKVGFVQEGIEREGAWIAGRWESDVMMSILEDEYRARNPTPTV